MAIDAHEGIYFEQALKHGRPYFGNKMDAFRGGARRHGLLRQVVEKIGREWRPLQILELGSWAGDTAVTWGQAIRDICGGQGTVHCVEEWRTEREGRAILQLFNHNIKVLDLEAIVVAVDRKSTAPPSTGYHIVHVRSREPYGRMREWIDFAGPLVGEGGILCGDGLELQAHEVATDALKGELRATAVEPKSGRTYHPFVTRAVSDVIGPVVARQGFWAARRVGHRWQPIELPTDGGALAIPNHLRPRSASDYFELALQIGLQSPDALALIETVQRVRRAVPIDVRQLAPAFVAAGRFDEAVDVYDRLRNSDPTAAEPYVEMVKIRLLQGRRIDGLRLLVRLLERSRDVPEARELLRTFTPQEFDAAAAEDPASTMAEVYRKFRRA